MESFVILVLIVVAGLGISAAAQSSKRKPIKDAWRAAASALNLGMEPGDLFTYPEIQGELRGHAVSVSTFTKGADSKRHTRYQVILRSSLGLDLWIGERTVRPGVQRLFRRHELVFDDPAFDERIVVRTRAPETVAHMLGPLRRRGLRDFYAIFPGTVIDDTMIIWETDGVEDRRDRIVKNVRGLVTMAEHLEHWSREPEPKPLSGEDDTTTAAAQTAAEPKRLPVSIRVTDASESERPPSLSMGELLDPGWMPPRQPEVDETDMSEEERVEADAVVQEPKPAVDAGQSVRVRMASDHAVMEIAPPAEAPAKPEEGEVTTVVPAPGAPTTVELERTAPLHPHDVSRILFASRLMVDELERAFATSFEGQRVLWPGTLRSVSTYPFDHVFGNERGARATFEIAELGDAYGARRVRAVVRLPEVAAKSLIPRVGQRLLFEGTLYRCEAFMRTLYLQDGSVPEVLSSDGQYS